MTKRRTLQVPPRSEECTTSQVDWREKQIARQAVNLASRREASYWEALQLWSRGLGPHPSDVQ